MLSHKTFLIGTLLLPVSLWLTAQQPSERIDLNVVHKLKTAELGGGGFGGGGRGGAGRSRTRAAADRVAVAAAHARLRRPPRLGAILDGAFDLADLT